MNKTYQDMVKYHDMVERAYARMDYLASLSIRVDTLMLSICGMNGNCGLSAKQ